MRFDDCREVHTCEICHRPAQRHHIITRGSGGKDDEVNIMYLCPDHHTMGPDAFHRIGRESFMARFPQFRERIEAACAAYGREAHKGRH